MAVAKPSKLPIWDINATNIVEPQSTNQSDGWQVDANGIPQKPPFQYHNYMWHTQYKWLEYLDAEKALLQGDSNKTFKVADATLADEAVNKGQLDTKLPSSSYTANDVLSKLKTVDGSGSGLDADTVDGVQGALLGIGGQGYAWGDYTASRALDTWYTNTSGKPISILINAYTTASGNNALKVSGATTVIINKGFGGGNGYGFGYQAIIPNGVQYLLTSGNGLTVIQWNELR